MKKNITISFLLLLNIFLIIRIGVPWSEKNSIEGTSELNKYFKNYLNKKDVLEKGKPYFFVYLDERGCIKCVKDEIKNLKNSNLSGSTYIIYNTISNQRLKGLERYNVDYFDAKNGEFANMPVLNPFSFVINENGFINYYKLLNPSKKNMYVYNENYYKFLESTFDK